MKIIRNSKEQALIAIEAFVVILLLGLLTENAGVNLMMAPFGATCAIVFGMKGSPPARPVAILFAYTVGALAGFLMFGFMGYSAVPMAVAVAITIFAMFRTTLIHPPAAGVPIAFYYIRPEAEFLFFPILAGCVIIIASAKIHKRICKTL